MFDPCSTPMFDPVFDLNIGSCHDHTGLHLNKGTVQLYHWANAIVIGLFLLRNLIWDLVRSLQDDLGHTTIASLVPNLP